MSLIPFILELADELHEFNRCLATGGMDVDDFGFGIYPHELQPQQQQQQPPPQQQQQQQSQHPLQQQQAQQQHLAQQQRRPRTLSQFYWLPNISKSRHHPYYRGKPCCNKTPIQLVHDHQLEKEASSTAGGGGGGGGVINSSPTVGAPATDKESIVTTTSGHATNSSSAANAAGNTSAGKSAYSVVNKNGFQVSMNVKQFAPNELTVKTIDNCIVVEGQHEDKEDGHGVISRHFIRKYMLPKGYDPSEVLSTLSSDGILTVKAPPPALKTDETMERIVDIQQTGGPVQIQQSAAKEPTNSAPSSGKEAQAAATAVGEQTVTAAAAVAVASLPIAVTATLQKQQQSQPQQPEQQQKQQKQQSQQLSATVEGVQQQQQQQQPTKLSQATTKDLQVTRERNGKLEPKELLAEQETETRTAEQTTTSSNTNNIAANNNNNNNNININTNSNNNNSGVANIDCSELNAAATSKATLQTEVKEKECDVGDAEQTLAALANVNKTVPRASVATKTSSAIDAIMADATADEPMETEPELQTVTKEEVVAQKPIVISILTAGMDDDTATANNIVAVVNSVTATATATTTTSNNNATSNDIAAPINDAVGAIEANGIEINTANNVAIELAPATLAEPSDIVLVANNGVSVDKTAPTGDALTISLETTVAELDGVTAMDTDAAEVADAVHGVLDADGMDGGVIAIGVDIGVGVGVGVDVNVITADGNNTTAQNAEDVNEESLAAGNLVVAAPSPTPADLVAAADAAILLAKAQCDGGAGDVAPSKPALTTEEITN